MKKLRLCVVGLLVLAVAGCGGAGPPVREHHASGRPRVVVVSIDGMMPQTYLEPDALGLAVPTLRELVRRGVVARVVPVLPTVTYPAHTTLVTGVAPGRHGITTNRPADALDKNQAGWRWYAEDIAVPTVWGQVAAQGREVALIEWPVTVGAKVSHLVPEFWRAGTADDQKLLRAMSTPGLLEAVQVDSPNLWTHLTPPNVADDAQFAIARHLLARHDPDLMLVHVWRTDDMQHDHGPRSAQAKASFEQVDALLGQLLRQLEASPRWAETTLVVVSDHGFAAIEREVRLGVLFEKQGLVQRGADGQIAQSRVTAVPNGGLVYVYATDAEAAAQAERAVRELGAPIAQILPAAEVARRGGDPSVAFAALAAPGFHFGDRRTGELFVDTPGRGTHGYLPEDPAMHASLLAVGPGLTARDLGVVPMTAIAPTLAALVGAPLPDASDPPLWSPSANAKGAR